MPRKHTLPLKKTRILREIDLALIKKNIMEELSPSFNIKHYEKFNHIKNPNDKEQYEVKYQEYLINNLNSKCISMIIYYVNNSNNLPKELKESENISTILISIIKKLMMNEFEISLFTLNIDYYGWGNNNKTIELYLLFIALYTKKLLNDKCNLFFLKFEEEYSSFSENYKNWENSIKKKIFSLIEISERFTFLNQSLNKKIKFIYFNSVVDKIGEMSLFNDEGNVKNLKVKEENLIDCLTKNDSEKNKNNKLCKNSFDSNSLKENSTNIIKIENEMSYCFLNETVEKNVSRKDSLDNNLLISREISNDLFQEINQKKLYDSISYKPTI